MWTGARGWPGSRGVAALANGASVLGGPSRLARVSLPASAPAPAPARTARRAQGGGARALASKTWSDVNRLNQYRWERGLRVAPVPPMLRSTGRSSKNLGRKVAQWKDAFGWTCRDIFTAQRKGNKPGGSAEHVGAEEVLKKIFDLKL